MDYNLDYSASSIFYLKAAYTIMIAAQVSYAVWLAIRWKRTRKPE